MYKKDFIFKLPSHPNLHYMINEYLPNGMRALDLARYFKLFDISKVKEEKDGREGIWSEIPREDYLRLQPCMDPKEIMCSEYARFTTLSFDLK